MRTYGPCVTFFCSSGNQVLVPASLYSSFKSFGSGSVQTHFANLIYKFGLRGRPPLAPLAAAAAL